MRTLDDQLKEIEDRAWKALNINTSNKFIATGLETVRTDIPNLLAALKKAVEQRDHELREGFEKVYAEGLIAESNEALARLLRGEGEK